jgi:Transposase IS66 family
VPDERTPRDDPKDLIERQQREIMQLREDLARAEQRRRDVERERDRLKRQNERLKQQLDAARRAGFRQAAPFAKDRSQGRGGRPGRRAGAAYGRRARRPQPRRVDETYTAPLPRACPDCGGAIAGTRVATQYQEDLPIVRPLVRRFDVHVGCCTHCGRRVQGRHPLQTSNALGAANVHLGPGAVTFVVLLHTQFGVPLEKTATVLRERLGLTVTAGGLAQVLHRTAHRATPTYTALCEQVRGSPVVSPDETGWRVGAVPHWLWVFATPETTVYAIRPGRSFDDAATILAPDFDGVLIRDGWAPYRQFTAALHQYWIPTIEAWDSRRESLGNYCSGLQLQWSSDKGATWTPLRPTANVINMTATLASPETFREFMTEQDWADLPGLLGSGFTSSLALKTLVTAYAALDRGKLRNALIEAVTVADLTVSEVVRRGLPAANRNSIGAFLKLPISTQLLVIATTSGTTALNLLDDAVAAIAARNRIVHEGWWPTDDDGQREIDRSLRSLLRLCALLLGNPIKFPQADVGNRTMA